MGWFMESFAWLQIQVHVPRVECSDVLSVRVQDLVLKTWLCFSPLRV